MGFGQGLAGVEVLMVAGWNLMKASPGLGWLRVGFG